jgi:hypothetical protein
LNEARERPDLSFGGGKLMVNCLPRYMTTNREDLTNMGKGQDHLDRYKMPEAHAKPQRYKGFKIFLSDLA